jgi:hypothetical protein
MKVLKSQNYFGRKAKYRVLELNHIEGISFNIVKIEEEQFGN